MTPDAPTPTPDQRPSRARRLAKLTASVAVLAGAGLAFAAFTAEQSNTGNAATAANLTVSDDVASATLFNPAADADLANWQPGDPEVRCIGIINGGSVPAAVTLRGNTPGGTGLGGYITMKLERGTFSGAHTSRTDCSNFVADASTPVFYNANVSAYPTAGGGTTDGGGNLAASAKRAYRVTWELQDDQAAINKSISAYSLTWRLTAQ